MPESGEITRKFYGINGGVWLEARTDTGYKLRFAHLSDYRAPLGRVEIGQTIAITGNTGQWTTGPHLHFEVWKDGKAINPEEYFRRMKYAIDKKGDQYVLFDLLMVGFSIADPEELDKLKARGLTGSPVTISDDELGKYLLYPGIQKERLKSILNI